MQPPKLQKPYRRQFESKLIKNTWFIVIAPYKVWNPKIVIGIGVAVAILIRMSVTYDQCGQIGLFLLFYQAAFLGKRGPKLSNILGNFWNGATWAIMAELRNSFCTSHLPSDKCDQIGRFFALWATFWGLWQQLIFPNLPHS